MLRMTRLTVWERRCEGIEWGVGMNFSPRSRTESWLGVMVVGDRLYV